MAILRVVVGGLLVGAQRWSVGFTCGPVLQPDPGALSTLASQLFADFNTTVWSATTTPYSAKVGAPATLDSVRAYYKTTSTSPAIVTGASSTAAVAATGSPSQAPQIALVATLEDGYAGRTHKGRMYLPFRLPVSAADQGVSTAVATDVATKVANFLSLVRTRSLGSTTLVPIVSSTTLAYPLTRVSVDTILDTQRRRRDKLVGNRYGANLVVG